MTVTRSLWSATATPGPVLGPLMTDAQADVVIVGGGYTGLSAALHLSEAGRDVVLLEAAEVGEGASGLNGGQVIPGLKYDPDELEEMLGPVLGPRLVQLVASGPDLVFDLIQRHAISCAATRTGWIQPATSSQALELIRSRVQQWRQRGAEVALLDEHEIARLTGSRRYSGGWIDKRGGTVQPLSYVRGLAQAAQRAGSRIFNRSPALALERTAAGWRVQTARGWARGAVLILATGAYTDTLADSLRRTLILVRSAQVATVPLPAQLRASILPEGQAASDTCHLLRYFRLDASGRLIMGSRGSFDAVPVEPAARHHYRAVAEIYPQLEGIPYEYHWSGRVGLTRDHLPHLHEMAPGLLAALGYNGRGVAMATLMGQLLARRAQGEPAEELGFPFSAVKPIPLHRFSQLGTRMVVQYLRALDGIARLRGRLAMAAKTA